MAEEEFLQTFVDHIAFETHSPLRSIYVYRKGGISQRETIPGH